MNFNNFTIKSQEAVQKATEIAAAKQNQAIETSHLLKGMLMVDENVIPYLLKKVNVNFDGIVLLNKPKQTNSCTMPIASNAGHQRTTLYSNHQSQSEMYVKK